MFGRLITCLSMLILPESRNYCRIFFMKKILAVSGGPDSMLLLWRFRSDREVVVAHFNHGTRPSADDDAAFVKETAEGYGLPFYEGKAELGTNVSEAIARQKRYEFLFSVKEDFARKNEEAKIFTAHHLNDLVETITINFLRGTGWRGLAPFSNKNVVRPFIEEGLTKRDIIKEIGKNEIVYRQDPTNVEENYLRNRVRKSVSLLDDETLRQIYNLYQNQIFIRKEIEELCEKIAKDFSNNNNYYPRDIFYEIDDAAAMEMLRAIMASEDIALTRPKMKDLLQAIRTYQPEKKFNLPNDSFVKIHKSFFEL